MNTLTAEPTGPRIDRLRLEGDFDYVSRCPWTHGQDMPMLQILLSCVGCGEAVGGTISKPLRWIKSHHLFRHDEYTDRGTHRTAHRSVALGRCFICVSRCLCTHGQDMPMLQILLSGRRVW